LLFFYKKKLLSDQDLMIVIFSNVSSAMHGLRANDVLLPTGHDVIVSPLPGGASGDFVERILTERP